jgi:uncharacterized repeat protein (TIGR01451 family)
MVALSARRRLKAPFASLLAVALMAIFLPLVGASTASASVITPVPVNGSCNGVLPTPGSANTLKKLIGGTLEPGGTAIFEISYPIDPSDNGKTFTVLDCPIIGGNVNGAQVYSFTSVPSNNWFDATIQLNIPAGTPIGATYCNYAKTTGSPTSPQASNRKAGPACFTVGGNLRIEKRALGHTGAGDLLAGASFDVSCPTAAPTTPPTAPPVVISGLEDALGNDVTAAYDAGAGAWEASGVADPGSIGISGPSGTACTVTETAAPKGYDLPTPASGTYVIPVGTSQSVVNWFNSPTPVNNGNLTIQKDVDKSTANTGGDLTYTITVGATGADQTDVTVTDTLPAGVTYTGTPTPTCVDDATPTPQAIPNCVATYDSNAGTLSWPVGTIANGHSATLSFQVSINSITPNPDGSVNGERLTNVAKAVSTQFPSGVQDDATTDVNPKTVTGDLTIAKDVDKATAPYGSTLTYTVTAGATGTRNQTNVVVTDALPSGTTYVANSATCTGGCSAAYDSNTNTVTWTIASISAGTSRNDLQFQVTINQRAANPDGSVSGETVTNTASGTSDSTPTPVTDDATTTVPGTPAPPPPPPPSNPGIVVLSLAKTAIPVSGSVVQPGQTINYTVTVKNSGNADAPGVTVVDTLPQHLTVNSSTISDNGVLDNGARTITWALGTVAADTTKAVTFATTVDQDTPQGTDLVNVATLGNQQSSTTHRVATGDLTLVKTVNPTSGAEYGSTLTYGLNAVATGTLNQTGVTVTDVVPTGTTYVAGSAKCLEPATSSECTTSYDAATKTVTWTLGSMAAGAARGLQFQVTIDTPAAAADGSIPATTITNVGNIKSDQTDVLPSNEVKTDVIAVLGEKTVKPPVVTPPAVEPQKLPFTGAPTSLQLGAGGLLLMLGAGLLMASRRRKA